MPKSRRWAHGVRRKRRSDGFNRILAGLNLFSAVGVGQKISWIHVNPWDYRYEEKKIGRGRGTVGKCTGPKWSKRPFWSKWPYSEPDFSIRETKMDQNGPFWSILASFWSILVHLGPPTVLWPFLKRLEHKPIFYNLKQTLNRLAIKFQSHHLCSLKLSVNSIWNRDWFSCYLFSSRFLMPWVHI